MSTDRTELESIVQEGSAFETIKRRLKEQGGQLREQVSGLNQAREEIFGSAGMNVLGRARVRTENNAIARDVVRLGDKLLFGFNLQLGLRKTLVIEEPNRVPDAWTTWTPPPQVSLVPKGIEGVFKPTTATWKKPRKTRWPTAGLPTEKVTATARSSQATGARRTTNARRHRPNP